MTDPIRLVSAAQFTERPAMPHQLAAWNRLQERQTPEVMQEFAELFRAGPKPVKAPLVQPVAAGNGSIELPGFPFFSQLDNGPNGWRQCQTSSIAMCLRYLKVPGITDDLDYLRVVIRHGDTTSQAAHTAALADLGVRARFSQNMSQAQLLGELKGGRPCAIGVLHHGPSSAPSGGGHYVAVYGATSSSAPSGGWRVMDPYGELDVLGGGWAAQGGNSGKGQVYSFRGLNPRWLKPGPSDGWGWLFS